MCPQSTDLATNEGLKDSVPPSLTSLLAKNHKDGRLYLEVKILDREVRGLLDSGASRTFLGDKGWEIVKSMGFNIQPTNEKVIVANGAECEVKGVVDLPFTLECHSVVLPVIIVPAVKNTLILGIDFWSGMGIVPNAAMGTWSFSDTAPVTVDSLRVLRPCGNLTAEQEKRLSDLLTTYLNSSSRTGNATPLVEHTIETGSAAPIKQRYYPVSPIVQKEIHRELDEMLKDGIVEPSASPWSSPILLVKKPS